ncbi:MAG: acyltransferase [Asticcacaulis sp.]
MAQALHPRESRFYELDILRGVAAIVVVIFHYKHFMLTRTAWGFDYLNMPFYRILMPVYVYGQFFVELFFSISGYVFFWLYADVINTRKTGTTAFFIARLARLYPLYFATLILVAILQWGFHSLYGKTFIYDHNSAGHFGLNLLMIQQWVPHPQFTFNGPAWSISVEVFLYVLFFLTCFLRLNRWWFLGLMVIGGLIYKYTRINPDADFLRGVPNFFLGGLVYYAVTALRVHEVWRKNLARALAVLVPLVWGLAYMRTTLAHWPMQHIPADPDTLSPVLNVGGFVYVAIPLLLLWLGLQQGYWPKFVTREGLHKWSWIGDISYSLYLIHFPLQLLIMLLVAQWPPEAQRQIFAQPLVFIGFMGVACGLAYLSFHAFEMPVRKIMRDGLMGILARRKRIR